MVDVVSTSFRGYIQLRVNGNLAMMLSPHRVNFSHRTLKQLVLRCSGSMMSSRAQVSSIFYSAIITCGFPVTVSSGHKMASAAPASHLCAKKVKGNYKQKIKQQTPQTLM